MGNTLTRWIDQSGNAQGFNATVTQLSPGSYTMTLYIMPAIGTRGDPYVSTA